MILDRYTIFPFLRSLVFSIFTFCILIYFAEALTFSKATSSVPLINLGKYFLFALPHYIAQSLPLSLMFAACFSMSQLNFSSELIAIYCGGRSFLRLIRFHLIISFVFAALLFLLNETILRDIIQEGFYYKSLFLQKISPNSNKAIRAKNLRGKEGFYYIHYYDPILKKVNYGFSYLKLDNNNFPKIFYEARTAYYRIETKDWLLKDEVKIIYFQPDLTISKIENLDEIVLSVSEGANFFNNASIFPEELQIAELYKTVKRLKLQGSNYSEYSMELNNRYAYSFNCLILCLIGLFGASLGSQRSGNSFVRALLLCTIVILIFYITTSFCTSMAKSGFINPALSSWIPNLLYLFLLFYFIKKRN